MGYTTSQPSVPVKTIPVADAVGTVLCHDITRIVRGQSKGPVFRKGHVVTHTDIPVLLSVGKENLYVYEPTAALIHENEAAHRIAVCTAGNHIRLSEAQEGRINFYATCHGLLQIDVQGLARVNALGEIALASLHSFQEVSTNQAVAGTRIIPLMIAADKIAQLEGTVKAPLVNVLPFRSCKVGIVTTGSEVFYGRIEDSFGPVVRDKFTRLGSTIIGQQLTNDSVEMTSHAISSFVEQGAEMIVVTGGMSVDPDDRSPAAIRASGAEIITYGAPTFPGSMFLLAYLGDIPILGLPGCVMYHNASIFDLIVPRLLAGLRVTAQDIAHLGHGGFCASCAECRYPVCPFGKS